MSELEHISTIMSRVFNDLAERAGVDVVSEPVELRQTEKEKPMTEDIKVPTTWGIYDALAAAQAEFPSIPKNRTARVGSYSYKYADLCDIVATIRPVLAKHGLSFTQFVADGDMVTRLWHRSGACIEGGVPLVVPADAKPQTLGSALTYSRRYSLGTVLGIVTDEDDDAQAAQNSGPARERKRDVNVMTEDVFKKLELGKRDSKGYELVTEKQLKYIHTMVTKLGLDRDFMKQAIKKSYGKDSSKDLSSAEASILIGELQDMFATDSEKG